MENDDVPLWAFKRADELMPFEVQQRAYDSETVNNRARAMDEIRAIVARYIAQHEKPPVDPDLMLAREIAALVAEGLKPSGLVRESAHTSFYRSGKYDDEPEMVAILKLLKERKG